MMNRHIVLAPIYGRRGCFWHELPDQLEYLVAAPQTWGSTITGDTQDFPDRLFLGVPPTTRWTPITVGNEGVRWKMTASNSQQSVLAAGTQSVIGPFANLVNLRSIALSLNGGISWSVIHTDANPPGNLLAGEEIFAVHRLNHGGFLLIATANSNDRRKIAVVPEDRVPSSVSFVEMPLWPTGSSLTDLAIESVGTRHLNALTTTDDNAGSGVFSFSRSSDYGRTWSEWEPRGVLVDRDYGSYPQRLYCFGTRQVALGGYSLYSDDNWDTFRVITRGIDAHWNLNGGAYEDMLDDRVGTPAGFDEITWGVPFTGSTEPWHMTSCQIGPNAALMTDVNFETHLITDERWDHLGYDDAIGYGFPYNTMTWSRQHGVLIAKTRMRSLAMTGDGIHWYHPPQWDTQAGSVEGLRFIQSVAVCGTQNQTLWDGLQGYQNLFNP